jgi:glyoxylase-like metal-dependent hydrolase (beta-lactamase superfamily II)
MSHREEQDHDHDALPCGAEPSVTASRRNILRAASAVALAGGLAGRVAAPAAASSTTHRGRGRDDDRMSWYRLVPGFVEVQQDPWGRPEGTGFAAPNPWGAYTAYLIHVSAAGHRTWRVENMSLTAPRPDGSQYAQGSTMWLFEGAERALLVDTAQNTPETVGVNDLKTVCDFLLQHEDDAATPRTGAVGFDVAITHRHGDHTGKVFQMTDRTVYYPDLDWTATTAAGPTWVPVREGGGATGNGAGQAVGSIDLGGRRIDAVAMYGHTPGSTGYLDAHNRLLATGDAIGSAYVWAHFASATTTLYLDMLQQLRKELRPLRDLAILPAHFYQIKQFGRGRPPLNGKPLDLEYVEDMATAAAGALDGSILADPYHEIGREAVWISGGSARMVYSLTNLYPGGPTGGGGDMRRFHGVNIPSRYPQDPFLDQPYAFLSNIRTGLVMIRDSANETSFLVRGTRRAALITSGLAARGLVRYAQHLERRHRVEVVLTCDADQARDRLHRFAGHRVWVVGEKSSWRRRGGDDARVVDPGTVIDLGRDTSGRHTGLRTDILSGSDGGSATLLDEVSRALFAGDALGTEGTQGLVLDRPAAEFAPDLEQWAGRTAGAYDTVYTAHNHQWFTPPGYVDALRAALAAPPVSSPRPGHRAWTSGSGSSVAWVFEPEGVTGSA